ncbi:MAG: copper amine oxidase N-terminal domain-containing protein [Desulfotomaculaceae bacterium]|nr:copper amine oxidase N-terminal domain-containing protein [Desulfotomaculaceae bacterium]
MKIKVVCVSCLALFFSLVLINTSSISSAAGLMETISVNYHTVKRIIIDGVDKTPLDERPFVYNDRTYVPLRYITEAIGKPVKWDASTGTIYIGSGGTVVYDDFTSPLSEKWDISNARGTWTITTDYGAYCTGQGWLPLKSEYITSENFTIECEVGFWNWKKDSPQDAGVLLFYDGESNYPPTICYMGDLSLSGDKYYAQCVKTSTNSNWEPVQRIYTDNKPFITYILMVKVKGDTVDVYLDNDYMFSSTIKEIKGNSLGLYTRNGGYIKNFRLTSD